MTGANTALRQDLIDQLAGKWQAHEIRELATTLMRLADSLDQDWEPGQVRAAFRWPNELARIEKNALNLAMKARVIYETRGRRREFIKADLLGEPAWDMLLDLFMQFAGGAKVSTTSLCLASRVPASTALRHIAALEDAGLVTRSQSEFDKRVTFVSLTDAGIVAMGRYLEQY